MTLSTDEVVIKCRQINARLGSRWHRAFAVSYRRCKLGLRGEFAAFTLKEKLYVWFGI